MKRLNYIIICLSLFISESCNDLLNTVPTDFVTSQNYYQTADQLNKGLAGIYDVLENTALYREALLTYMSYSNDEAVFVYDKVNFTPASNFTYTSNFASFTNLWNQLYKGINYANILLEAIDSPVANNISQEDKDDVRAQTLFLRAYFFYMLVERWGAIPMPLTSTKSAADINMASTTIADVYKQIITDMTFSQTLLKKMSVIGDKSSGRISKNSAQGILARVCLSNAGFPLYDESKYIDARAWCDSVMQRGENMLDPCYSDLFIKEARDEYYVKENMWEVEFYGNATDGHSDNGYVGVRNGIPAINGLEFPGYGYEFLGASIDLYNKYQIDPNTKLSNDLRRERNIAPYRWIGGSTSYQIMTKNYWVINSNLYNRWPGKWRRDEEILTPRYKNGNGTNFPLLRYADVLLMFAEAENHINGPTVAAYNAINSVRRRAYGTGFKVSKITVVNGGSGYPTITTSGEKPVSVNVNIEKNTDSNNASSAEAYATVSGGKITNITLVSMGAFYNSTAPLVTISSSTGAGSGATATATVTAINPLDADLSAGLSKEQFFEEIKAERSRELAFECLRTQDLRRWGILIPTIKDLSTKYASGAPAGLYNAYSIPGANISTKHLFYPIPPSEMSTNALIVQNPGW